MLCRFSSFAPLSSTRVGIASFLKSAKFASWIAIRNEDLFAGIAEADPEVLLGAKPELPALSQCCSSNIIPAQANLKAMKARIPSATPFFCFTNENETTNTVSATKNRSRLLGNERAKETAKQ